jgi:DNA-binding NarL/FixJ family response regulator
MDRTTATPKQVSMDQLAIVRLLAAGQTDAEIARVVFVSERTVRRQIGLVMTMYGLRTRAQLAAYAASNGWLVA